MSGRCLADNQDEQRAIHRGEDLRGKATPFNKPARGTEACHIEPGRADQNSDNPTANATALAHPRSLPRWERRTKVNVKSVHSTMSGIVNPAEMRRIAVSAASACSCSILLLLVAPAP